MSPDLIVVESLIPTHLDDTDLREEVWSFALDQRAFGPRRLLVALADPAGRLVGLAHTARTDPPELALGPCVDYLGQRAAAAVAFCDEPLSSGPPPADLGERFALARSIAATHGVHLVDWIACDDQLFRSTRMALGLAGEWWDVPPGGV